MQLIGARFTTRGPINQETRAPPHLGFPHTMLSVKRVKDNMRLTLIEKLFTNRKIGTRVQTRYLCFKSMLYESESYLFDISYVQSAMAWFHYDNSQLEVMLGAWKGVPYIEKFCQGCDLGKVKDEEHLLLLCQNTQKVRERFCLALPSPTLTLLLNSCKLQTRSPCPSLWHAASIRG